MHNILKVFRRDVVRILKNPVALVVTLGVAVIPGLYAWFNILANWDPYQNTGTIAVAVANDDRGADVEGVGHMDVGAEVVDALKDNHKLGWTFVDRDAALAGVDSGAYYAAIVIPDNFSEDLASVMTGDLKRPELEYYVNEKLNAVAPKVTDSGATTVENTVNEQFVQTVTKVVGDKTKELAGNITHSTQTATDNAAARVRGAKDDLERIGGLIEQTRSTCRAASSEVRAANGVLDELASSVDSASDSVDRATGRLDEARGQARSLTSDLDRALVTGSTTVAGISSKAATDVAGLASSMGGAQSAADQAVSQLQTAQDSLSRAKKALDEAVAAVPGDQQAAAAIKERLQKQAQQIQEQLDAQQQVIDKLKALSTAAKDGTRALTDGTGQANDAVASASQGLLDARQKISNDALPAADSALDGFSSAAGGLQKTLGSLSGSVRQAKGSVSQLASTIDEADTALGSTREALSAAEEDLDGLATDLAAVSSSEAFNQAKDLLAVNPEEVADFMASPVTIEEKAVFPVANYGSGVAPFYTDLALFVGGFVLVSIYKLEVDSEGVDNLKPWQAYFGRGLLLVLVGTMTAVITCVGDLLLGIQCVDPAAFVFAGIVESFVYVNLVYALAVAFKHIGKALAVLIVILQIPGSSGLYPIQMQPDFFRALSPWLPFTYGNNAMREAIAGFYDGHYAHDLAMLLLFLVPALLIGVVLRRYLLNLNRLFDAKLRETDLMTCERTVPPEANFRLTTLIKAALDTEGYRRVFLERCAWFNLHYQTMVNVGFKALLLCFTVLLVPMFVAGPEVKFVVLVVWIVAILALMAFLIVVEFLHERMNEKTDLTSMPREKLLEMVGQRLDHEIAPIAPFSKIRGSMTLLPHLNHVRGSEGPDDGNEDEGKGGDER